MRYAIKFQNAGWFRSWYSDGPLFDASIKQAKRFGTVLEAQSTMGDPSFVWADIVDLKTGEIVG